MAEDFSNADIFIYTNVDKMLEYHTCTVLKELLSLVDKKVVIANKMHRNFSTIYKNISSSKMILLYRVREIPKEIIALRQRGMKIGYIVDDNIFYSEGDNLIPAHYRSGINKTVKECDFAFATNVRLTNELMKVNPNSYCIGNFPIWEGLYSKMGFQKPKRNNGTNIRIGVIGGLGNANESIKFIENLIDSIGDRDDITIVYFSNKKIEIKNQIKLEHHRYVSSSALDWYNKLHGLSLDAVFAQYEDNILVRSKSNLKFRESAMMKVPLLAIDESGCVYIDDIEQGVNGFWCSSKDEFKNEINKFLNKEKLKSMGDLAYLKLTGNDPVSYAADLFNKMKKIYEIT